MKSFRVHTTESADSERIPYLLLEFLDGSNVSLDFQWIEGGLEETLPQITLSAQALYEVLEGKELSVLRDEGTIMFRTEGEVLVIVWDGPDERPSKQYRVWTAEVSVAWNMLGCS
jgi:hypothetical protein